MRQRRVVAAVFAFALLATLLTACGGDDGGSDATGQDPADLEGKAWVLTQMLDADGNTQIVDIGVNADFDGSRISGISGCNNYNADYTATGNEISFGPIASTKEICPSDERDVEDQYLTLLATVATYDIEGRSMSMSDGEGTPILQYSQG